MRRNPLYVFEDLNSTGIYNVPLESTIQINDADGQGSSLIVQIVSKDNMNSRTTIGDFLLLEDNYEKPSAAGMVTDEQKGKPEGVAPLDDRGFVPGKHIPTMDINDVYIVNTQQEMLDMTNNVNVGDVCVVTGESKTYIFNGGYTGTIQDWTQMLVQSGTVQSVNGKSGNVVLNADDIDEGLINKYMNPTSFKGYLSQEKIESLSNVIDGPSNNGDALIFNGSNWVASQIPQKVVSVNGLDGVVQLTTNDIPEDTNEYYTNAKVDQRIQGEWIDPISGIGDFNKIWSADKIATELSYLTTKDYVDNGLATKADVIDLDTKFDKVGGELNRDGQIIARFEPTDILLNGEVTVGEIIKVGVGTSGSSIVAFKDTNNVDAQPGFYWSNTDSVFKVTDDLMDNNTPSYKVATENDLDTKFDKAGGEIQGNVQVHGVLEIESSGSTGSNDEFRVSYANAAPESYTLWHSGNLPINVAAAVSKIADPSTATTEDVANKINELIDSLTNAGLMA